MDGTKKKQQHLYAVPLCSDAEYEAVHAYLTESGFNVRLFTPDQIDCDQGVPANSVFVLIFGRYYQHFKEVVSSLLLAYPDAPKFGVFYSGAIRLGQDSVDCCCEFVSWPCQYDELAIRLTRLIDKAETVRAYEDAEYDDVSVSNLIGESPEFSKVLKLIKTYAGCSAPVLIEGETGTGKELVARAIHYMSARSDQPFIPVNCGALPDNLIENELFGHVKGAYTDAKSGQQGLIGEADQGTLFLDEVEALSPKAQVALLRFLQEKEYRPLGAGQALKADVRILAASNVNLQTLVDSGQVRQDLFFRLNILAVTLPGLRERRQDILPLAKHFLNQYASQYGLPRKIFHFSAADWLQNHDWPGNVRELENVVHKAVLISSGVAIMLEDLNADSMPLEESDDGHIPGWDSGALFDVSFNEAKSKIVAEFEKRYLYRLMRQTNGNVTLAAKQACKERRAFGKLLKKYGIDRNLFV